MMIIFFELGFDLAAFSHAVNKFFADITASWLKYSEYLDGSIFVFKLELSTEPV